MGRRSRAVRARREQQVSAAEPPERGRTAGRRQAYEDAYAEARERAEARRRRPRGPWQQRGARVVRAAVSDEEWQQLADLAGQQGLPASVYLGQLIRAHVADPKLRF